MKRILCLILAAFLLCSLWGCEENSVEDQATFYYCREKYAYGTEGGIIGGEQRDITGHAGDVNYLLALYLVGPLEEDLTSPFPERTQLLSARLEADTLFIELSDMGKGMTDAQFSLACASLVMTCMELTDAAQVTIASGERSITMDPASLLLYDSITPGETNTTEETQ